MLFKKKKKTISEDRKQEILSRLKQLKELATLYDNEYKYYILTYENYHNKLGEIAMELNKLEKELQEYD